jgi:hypothetical protein
MKIWVLAFSLFSLPLYAAEVRVLEPANRIYIGALDFIESNGRLEPYCIRLGTIVFRNAPFSAETIERMRERAAGMGADTLVIKDTTRGPVNLDYVIGMRVYRCNAKDEATQKPV